MDRLQLYSSPRHSIMAAVCYQHQFLGVQFYAQAATCFKHCTACPLNIFQLKDLVIVSTNMLSCLLKHHDKITRPPENIAACTLKSTHQDNCCCQASICTGIEPMDKSEQIDDFNFNISMNLCMKPPKNSDQAH